MAKDTKQDALMQELVEELRAIRAENAQLRQQVESQTQAASHHQARHAALNPLHAISGSELMVGIRNISDNVVGIPGFPVGSPDISLNPGLPGQDNTTAVVSYVHWTRLRGSDFVKKGFICRDDSVLGTAFTPAPADLPSDIPAEASINAIEDPEQWIASRDDEALTRDILAITSDDSLRRLRTVVDRWLFAYQSQLPDPFSVKSARETLNRLPARLAKVDELTTQRLEREDADTGPISNIKLTPMDVARMRTSLRTG